MSKMGEIHKMAVMFLAAGFLLAAATLGQSQSKGSQGQGNQGPVNAGQQSPTMPSMQDDPTTQQHSRRLEDEQARMRNTDRQKRLVSDTEKLLELAGELKVEVDKTDKNMLSVDVIRKADEIERLAHSVKERMKG